MNLTLQLLCLLQLGLVASSPIQKVITNHCDNQDCEIDVMYSDGYRDISLQTSNNDSVVSALLDISIMHQETATQDDLVDLMGNVVQMLSSMIYNQRGNHEQLDNMTQQLDIFQPSPTPDLLDYLTTSPEPEILTNQQSDNTETKAPMPDCANAPSSGQHIISPPGVLNPFIVVCDVNETTGGWIVLQRRFDGSLIFDRDWSDYEIGFGSLNGEFWLGLEQMYTLTNSGTWKLRIDLEDFDGNRAYAEYDSFKVGVRSSYPLTIGSYSGNAGDAIKGYGNPNGWGFTTKNTDRDNYSSGNCGDNQRSGWWHYYSRGYCTRSNINGVYDGEGVTDEQGMSWYTWKNSWEPLKKTEMMIQRVD